MEAVELKIGGVIAGRYTLCEFVTKGGQAEVWIASEAVGPEPHPVVAIKVFRGPALDGGWAEIRSLASVQHPNVLAYRCALAVRDGITGQDAVCMVMERAHETARQWAERRRGQAAFEAELTDLAHGWAQGLMECHDRAEKILHKDIKPDNLFVVGGRVAKIGDFGVARWTSNAQTRATTRATYEYAAPEVLGQEPFGAPADLYALGATLHELWTGRLPYDPATTREALAARRRGELSVDGGLPAAWREAMGALLARAPAERWTAEALAAWLARQREARVVAPIEAELASTRAELGATREALASAEVEVAALREAGAEAARAHEVITEDLRARVDAAVLAERALRKAAAATEAELRAQVAALSARVEAAEAGTTARVRAAAVDPALDARRWADEVVRDEWGVCAIVRVEVARRVLRVPVGRRAEELRFRWAPPGRFMCGSPETEAGRDQDEVQREVVIPTGFWVADAPVTQARWAGVMGTSPSEFRGDDRPVENVSWDDAQAFLARLEALRPGLGARLPSEVEWEYACRAGTTWATYAGDLTLDEAQWKAPELDAIAWYGANAGLETHPVRTKRPNAWGLYDTLGNVWEWCEDWFVVGSARVLRGGAWYGDARYVRAARRLALHPGSRYASIGFRLSRGQVRPAGPEGRP